MRKKDIPMVMRKEIDNSMIEKHARKEKRVQIPSVFYKTSSPPVSSGAAVQKEKKDSKEERKKKRERKKESKKKREKE